MRSPGVRVLAVAVPWLVAAFGANPAYPQAPVGTAFTFQGQLKDGGSPANGSYDLRLLLYDAPVGGSQVGPIATLEDVPVSQGLFTVVVDFGPAAFVGQARWLELAVRPGTSTGTFVPLAGRQELRPAPQSVFSASTPWDGISGKPPGFADGVDDDRLQSLACSAGQVAKWNGSAWACAPDASSGGTVLSVATGTGLTGGPITTSGTVAVAPGGIATASIADGAVTAAKIADGAVGLAQIDPAQVQARVGGTCPPGSYLRGINPDGSVACAVLPVPTIITTVDDPPANNVGGGGTSIAIGADGRPVISYRDTTALALKIAKCGNAACSTGNTITTVDDPANSVGISSSIAIGPDGLPVVSHQDGSAGTLRVLHCGNAACTSGNQVSVVDDPVNAVGGASSLAIGADGLPVISYRDTTAGALKVAKCGNPACSGGNSVTTVDDPPNNVGADTSLAIGADGLPVIGYSDTTAGALKVAKCGNAACTAGNTISVVDDSGDQAGQYLTLAVGPDGRPVVAYQAAVGTVSQLRVTRCGNASCSAGNVTNVVDASFSTGVTNSVRIAPDGLPVISYHQGVESSLWVAKCGDPACASGNVLTRVDDYPAGTVGLNTALAIGADGLPVISYYDNANQALEAAKCGNAACQ